MELAEGEEVLSGGMMARILLREAIEAREKKGKGTKKTT